MVRILHGKGDKFRLVPIGEVALDALNCWRRLTRSGGSREPVFINFRDGRRLTSRPAAHSEATGRTQRHPEPRHAARLQAFLCNPSADAWRRSALDSVNAQACELLDDAHLYAPGVDHLRMCMSGPTRGREAAKVPTRWTPMRGGR